jgi:hypothetical protein
LTLEDNDNSDHVAAATRAGNVVKVEVPRSRADTLLRELDDFYDEHLDTVTYAPSSGLWFVRYRGNYHLCHNCNHVTAQWLRELDCEVRGGAMFSKFIVRAPGPTSAPARDEKLENRLTYGRPGD